MSKQWAHTHLLQLLLHIPIGNASMTNRGGSFLPGGRQERKCRAIKTSNLNQLPTLKKNMRSQLKSLCEK